SSDCHGVGGEGSLRRRLRRGEARERGMDRGGREMKTMNPRTIPMMRPLQHSSVRADVTAPSSAKVVDKVYAPKEELPDRAERTYTFTVNDDFRAGKVLVDLDIDHENRTDLLVTVTSPSGTTAQLNT